MDGMDVIYLTFCIGHNYLFMQGSKLNHVEIELVPDFEYNTYLNTLFCDLLQFETYGKYWHIQLVVSIFPKPHHILNFVLGFSIDYLPFLNFISNYSNNSRVLFMKKVLYVYIHG